MQHIFIINPAAGKVDASVALIPQIHAAASRSGLPSAIQVTCRAGRARDLALNTCAAGGRSSPPPVTGDEAHEQQILQGTVSHRYTVGCVPAAAAMFMCMLQAQAQFLDLDAQLAHMFAAAVRCRCYRE
ncbi:MAG: hypothetical protein ACLT3F_07565 [Gemmiger formicilis]|uniref:hypothetical protein n=1 Tax=Gemmiger formicilis TaxID=745368 RepID=UPI003996A272